MRAMEQVSAPVVAIAFILAAVFIPVAFLGGISGQIYRQFALTIAISVLLSAFSALSLSPALSALLLKPHKKSRGPLDVLFRRVQPRFRMGHQPLSGGRWDADPAVGAGAAWIGRLLGGWQRGCSRSCRPDSCRMKIKALIFVPVRLPDGASIDRTDAAVAQDRRAFGQGAGRGVLVRDWRTRFHHQHRQLKRRHHRGRHHPWEKRKSKDLQLDCDSWPRTQRALADVPEAFTFAVRLSPDSRLEQHRRLSVHAGGSRRGGELDQLSNVADALVDAARKRPEIGNVINTFRSSVPAYSIDMDLDKLQTMGVPVTDAYNTLQTFLGGLYVNDFNRFSHTWQVLIQAEPEFRDQPLDIDRFYVRSVVETWFRWARSRPSSHRPAPKWCSATTASARFRFSGAPAPGVSSGQAIDAMEKVAAETLPPGYGYEWTGTTYQQKLAQGHEGVIFGFATVLVFLCLAALYESWSIPFAVLLSLPLGLFGALLAVYLRNFPYDIYTQIGIVTLIGLAAKNAILIVEFAKESHERELMPVREAALHAAKLRLRPILMTSFAFILGVVPLFLATGARAASRRSLGTAVFGGMLAATLLAIFFVPVQYFVIESFVERGKKPAPSRQPVEATD